MAGTPILTHAETNIKSLILGMTVAGDYNFDWSTVNDEDLARWEGFPGAVITLEPDETNLDDITGVHAGAYLNEVSFKIRVVGKLNYEEHNPVFAINDILNKCLDDLKKVFGSQPGNSLNGYVDVMQYRRSIRIRKKTGDIFIPTELETFWMVRYMQDRIDPTQGDA